MTRPLQLDRPYLARRAFRAIRSIARRSTPDLLQLPAMLVGTLAWLADDRGRATVRRNLAHFIPARCPEALARSVWRSYVDFCRYVPASLRMDRIAPGELGADRLTIIDPWAVFRHPPLAGPAILAVAHCNWELTGAVLRRTGMVADIEGVMLSSGDAEVDALYERVRSGVPGRTLWLGREPLAALRALKAGRILAVAADRDYSHHGLRLPFAGQTMSIPRGPAALAVQTGAPIIPLLLARSGPSTWVLLVAKPLKAREHLPKNAQVDRITRELAATMERFVAAAPSQWVAFHDAWAPLKTPG